MDGRLKWAVVNGSKGGVFVQANDGQINPRLYLEMRLSPCDALIGGESYALRVWCRYKREYLVERQLTAQVPKQAQIDQAKFVNAVSIGITDAETMRRAAVLARAKCESVSFRCGDDEWIYQPRDVLWVLRKRIMSILQVPGVIVVHCGDATYYLRGGRA